MKEANVHNTVFLKNYLPSVFSIDSIDLTFSLGFDTTTVISKYNIFQTPGASGTTLELNGEDLGLVSVKVNQVKWNPEQYEYKDKILKIHGVPPKFQLEIENTLAPSKNLALEGLYKTGEILCTQNEPEGFRKITFYIDRPDVMAMFRTKIIGSKKEFPIMLANGNLVESGDLEGGRHFAVWEDPFRKPSYLFALVAGDLAKVEDSYTTLTGKRKVLHLFVDRGNEYKCGHAMESLKKSMLWDEQVFNLEYDLDIYMIVAVDAFNMGAMENKGLNIFNSSAVLAHPSTATDMDFHRIESVVAHEYFHNWTGNRVTVRDWFQLTLKEGLTVFRDQEFSSDVFSRPFQRISDVNNLRNFQFPEDEGPNAHPIRPDQYIEINNFYTSTVYEKGSEVIRMVETLIGKENFKKGIKKYFELYDGKAVTTEDFIHAMSLGSGFDFTQFKRWYAQAGTPEVEVSSEYDANAKKLKLKISQNCPETPGQKEKLPFHFPFRVGLIGKKSEQERTLEITKPTEDFLFTDIPERPVLSLNRAFSAPVKVINTISTEDLCTLLVKDSDGFNRWNTSQELFKKAMRSEGKDLAPIVSAFRELFQDKKIDDSFKALCLTPPTLEYLCANDEMVDYQKAFSEKVSFMVHLGKELGPEFSKCYAELQNSVGTGDYQYGPGPVGARSLKHVALNYLMRVHPEEWSKKAFAQYSLGTNMTEAYNALVVLTNAHVPERAQALDLFYEKWKSEFLVVNKWLELQAISELEGTYAEVQKLMHHPAFDMKNPNKLRALVGSFARNLPHFHHSSGRGYTFVAQVIQKVDALNPTMASRMAGYFNKYPKLDALRKDLVKTQLEDILRTSGLSKNTYEIVHKTLQMGA